MYISRSETVFDKSMKLRAAPSVNRITIQITVWKRKKKYSASQLQTYCASHQG